MRLFRRWAQGGWERCTARRTRAREKSSDQDFARTGFDRSRAEAAIRTRSEDDFQSESSIHLRFARHRVTRWRRFSRDMCVEGEALAKRLEKAPLPLEQVLKYGAQIADALDKAHRAGKPGNIVLTPTCAKLLDFGLAKPAAPLVSDGVLRCAQEESTSAATDLAWSVR